MGLALDINHWFLGAIVTNSSSTESTSSLKGLKEEVLSVLSQEAAKVGEGSDGQSQSTVSITVVGASGDLAKKKIFPALFALYYEDCLPEVSLLPSYVYFLCNCYFDCVLFCCFFAAFYDIRLF